MRENIKIKNEKSKRWKNKNAKWTNNSYKRLNPNQSNKLTKRW